MSEKPKRLSWDELTAPERLLVQPASRNRLPFPWSLYDWKTPGGGLVAWLTLNAMAFAAHGVRTAGAERGWLLLMMPFLVLSLHPAVGGFSLAFRGSGLTGAARLWRTILGLVATLVYAGSTFVGTLVILAPFSGAGVDRQPTAPLALIALFSAVGIALLVLVARWGEGRTLDEV